MANRYAPNSRVVCLLLLFLQQRASVKASEHNNVIRLGVILPQNETDNIMANMWTLPKTEPAIRYALSSVANASGILPGYTFELVIEDSKCSHLYGPLAAIDMYASSEPVHAYIGPACEYSVAPIARYASAWNIPVITAGALSREFQNKETYALLTRMTSPYEKLAESVNRMTDHFNWEVRGIVYEGFDAARVRSVCHFIAESLYMGKRNTASHLKLDVAGITDEQIKTALLRISAQARIVFLCFEKDLTRDILINAAELGMDNGDYVFIDVAVFAQTNSMEAVRPWYRASDDASRNALARRGYSALLIVSQFAGINSPAYEQFSKQMNLDYGTRDEKVNDFVIAFHDAILLYANALNRTLADGFDARNGKEVTKRMWNTTIQGVGGSIVIDANGDRVGDYMLRGYQPDTENFAVVGTYYGETNKYIESSDRRIHWPADRLTAPPDVPECGFDGSLCSSSSQMSWWGYLCVVTVMVTVICVV